MKASTGISGAGLAVGLGLVAIAAVIGFDAARMDVPPSYARVGPHIFPILVSIGLGLSGLTVIWQSLRGVHPSGEEAGDEPTEWKSVGIIAAGLILHMNLLKPAGFVPAGVVLFMAVAFAFGSRRYLRDVIIGLIVAFAAYIGFRYGLGLQLPPGILKGII